MDDNVFINNNFDSGGDDGDDDDDRIELSNDKIKPQSNVLKIVLNKIEYSLTDGAYR